MRQPQTDARALSRERIADCFSNHEPRIESLEATIRAAVAMVLAPSDDGPGVLLIQRSDSDLDRWSGHIAFPGGRVDAGDAGPREAAERETCEETGLDLRAADPIGRLDDLTGSVESILVSGFVYWLPDPPALVLNEEVQRAAWLPVRDICDPARQDRRTFDYKERKIEAPAIRVFEPAAPVLWGISYRFLELLMRVLGREIPAMQWHSEL